MDAYFILLVSEAFQDKKKKPVVITDTYLIDPVNEYKRIKKFHENYKLCKLIEILIKF